MQTREEYNQGQQDGAGRVVGDIERGVSDTATGIGAGYASLFQGLGAGVFGAMSNVGEVGDTVANFFTQGQFARDGNSLKYDALEKSSELADAQRANGELCVEKLGGRQDVDAAMDAQFDSTNERESTNDEVDEHLSVEAPAPEQSASLESELEI